MPIVSEDLTVDQEFQACSSTTLLETAAHKRLFSSRFFTRKHQESEKLPTEAFHADLIFVFEN